MVSLPEPPSRPSAEPHSLGTTGGQSVPGGAGYAVSGTTGDQSVPGGGSRGGYNGCRVFGIRRRGFQHPTINHAMWVFNQEEGVE